MPSDVPPVTANREWMDRDNASPLRSGVRLQPNQNRRLMGVRLTNNEKAVTRRRSGATRVIVYSLTRPGGSPESDWAQIRELAAQSGFAITLSLHDETGPSDPMTRPDWQRVHRLVAAGYAQGVVVVDRNAVSGRDDHYEEQLAWFAEHAALVCLVRSEAAP